MTTAQMYTHLRALSRFCGLEHAVLPNVLRRTSAYILANSVSNDERYARMGHTNQESTYWKYYCNTTSTVDFQGLRHNIEQENVSVMSSIFLGIDKNRPPPDRVSEKGMTEVYQNPELLSLLDEVSAILDQLVQEHGSIANPRALDPEKYVEECRAHFNLGDTEAQNVPIPAPGPSQVDTLLDEQEFGMDYDLASDPQLVAEDGDASEALAELADGLTVDDEAADDDLDDAQENEPNNGATSSSRRLFGRRKIARHTLIDEVPAYLYNQTQEEASTWNSMSAHFTTAFNHLHQADRFYPGQESLPGTHDCRFCGVNFHTMHNQQIHVHADLCCAERLFQNVLGGLQALETTAASTCPLPGIGRDGTSLVDSKAKPRHHDTPFLAVSIQDFRIHIVRPHNVPKSILKWERPGGGFNLWDLMFFCPFCQEWIPRTYELQEPHLAAHVNDAIETITKPGLAGGWHFHHWTHPGFCPFCVYDTELGIVDRFECYASPTVRQRHIVNAHPKKMTARILCPATASTPEALPQCPDSSTALNVEEMQAHLAEAHGYEFTSITERALPSDDVQPKKKAKTAGRKPGRKPLAELDANQQVV
ncbi:hypothetical protein diail_1152 [Diaporthe ilicicola]|nr:hypothetical protein diail_1152 [Diaporthe ilicicola]